MPTVQAEVFIPKPIWKPVKLLKGIEGVKHRKLQGVPIQAVTKPPKPKAVSNKYSGSHSDWLRAAGVPSSAWSCAEALVMRESGWRVDATNPTSGAYGLPQALPPEKMATAGADWRTNPVTQLKWMHQYVEQYGGWCGADAFQRANNWY